MNRIAVDALKSPETPWWMIVSLRNQYRIMEDFVETGTGIGATSEVAATLFQRVFTIEVDREMYRRADALLAAHRNVKRFLGDSSKALVEVVAELGPKAMFYLDGHWCGGARTAPVECPLLQELEIINRRGDAKDCILIDNAGMFLHGVYPPHRPQEWPTIDQVVATIKKNPKWSIQRICDCLIVTPDPIFQVY